MPPNTFFGFRTATTLADPDIWRKANHFAGWAMMVAAAVGAAITYVWPEVAGNWGAPLVLGLTVLAVGASFAYLALVT